MQQSRPATLFASTWYESIRKNMKSLPISLQDKALLRARCEWKSVIECSRFDEFKD
jgi:hypothetical protein